VKRRKKRKRKYEKKLKEINKMEEIFFATGGQPQ
jgi:hypothetical protein